MLGEGGTQRSASSHTKTRSNAALSTGAKTDDEEEEGEGEASPTETESNGASPSGALPRRPRVSEMHGRTSSRLTGNDSPSEVSTSTTESSGAAFVLAIFRPPEPPPGLEPDTLTPPPTVTPSLVGSAVPSART